ncbi:MAG: hypothetical protein ACLFVW_02905 [Phycisphaerae bacterium]
MLRKLSVNCQFNLGIREIGMLEWILLGGAFMGVEAIADKRKKRQQLWQRISLGMTGTEVSRVLGRPEQIAQAGTRQIWKYGAGPFQGTVTLEQGKVIEYKKPSV